MSALQLLDLQVSLFVVVSVIFLLVQEYKRQTSAIAQVGRAWNKYVKYCENNKEYFLQAYQVIFGLINTDVTTSAISHAASQGNAKADEVIGALKNLAEVIAKSNKATK